MNKIVIALIIIITLLTGGTFMFLKSMKTAESDSTKLVGEPTSQIPDSHLMRLESSLHPNGKTEGAPEGDNGLIDGTVAREWGDFIKAKDIRIDCRDVRLVVREVPRPEDYSRKCGHFTEFDHPYAGFTDEQLEQIANYDAAAAYLLAHRLLIQPSQGSTVGQNPERGLSHAMNALVQTGEKQVFDLLIEGRHFKNWSVWATVNGVPNAREIREKEEEYVWYRAGHNIGLIADDDYGWKRLLGTMQRFESYFDMDELNSRAAIISDGIKRQRSLVTGK